MSTLNDEILRATGGPTVNDGLRAWFLSHGATGPATAPLNDLERQFLQAANVGPGDEGTNNDLWMKILDTSGYNGTYNDKLLQFWSAQ